ncbi:MAG: sigma 54-interacting transcriptional regulator [Myxococcota bacterium]
MPKAARVGHVPSSVVLYTRDGARVVPLREEEGAVVGRFPPADVAVRDPSLSRQHARFEIVDDETWVEDLDSTNGTWVNGERVERARIQPGDTIALGTVVAFLITAEHAQHQRFGIISHDWFARELAREVARAHHVKRSLMMAMVRCSSLQHVTPVVQGSLRQFDLVGLYSRDTLEVLLPEASMEEARALAQPWLEASSAPLVSFAIYPDHAASADELIEVALGTLHRAKPGQIASAAVGARPPREAPSEGIVIASPKTRQLHDMVKRLASSSIPVLLLGETGTGKEVFSRAIHELSPRRNGPMVCVNCGGIPSQLVESTLFGHTKGAFTGASQQAKGVFESADGGTALLDEIGELPLPAQAALLRVLETRRFCRVGSQADIEVDVRIIAATHRDLNAMADEGAFRRDLLFRLNAMTLRIPPLRERPEEIEPLAVRFLEQASGNHGAAVTSISPHALNLLRRHSWPGNVRELRNVIERAVVIAHGTVVQVDDLPESLRALSDARTPTARTDTAPPLSDEINLRTELQRYEASLILRALEASDWQRKDAARLLGLPLRTLAHRLQVLGIRRQGYAIPES